MRRKINKLTLVLSCGLLLFSCKKDEAPRSVASLNVINVATGAGPIKVNASGNQVDWSNVTTTIAFGASSVYTIPEGNLSFNGATTGNPNADLFNLSKTFKSGGLYTLFVVGETPNIETIFNEENYPSYPDSALAVRVVNASPNSAAINVTLATSTTINEFSNLTYKQQSEFKKYSAKPGVTNAAFNFQIRNMAGVILASYPFTATNLSQARFKGVTLVFRGLVGGTGINVPLVSFVPNY